MIVLSRWLDAYAALSPRERRLMDLVEVRGLSYAAAAEDMGLGLSNVKMILFRARTRMRQRIGCEFEQAVRRAG
jgi:DNA-directed RNA polymerase specialized sigma24 family protein